MSDEIKNNAPVDDTPEDVTLTRRQVLTQAIKTATGAGVLLLLPMAHPSAIAAAHKKPAPKKATPKKPAPAKPAPAETGPDTTGWTALGDAATFTKDQPQRVALATGAVLYVTRLTDTTFSAVSSKCTHRGCEVAWKQDMDQLVCPCHGAAFDSTGKNLHGTSRQPGEALPALASLPAVQKNSQVFADLRAVPAPSLIPGH